MPFMQQHNQIADIDVHVKSKREGHKLTGDIAVQQNLWTKISDMAQWLVAWYKQQPNHSTGKSQYYWHLV
jgi:hypothetical protein